MPLYTVCHHQTTPCHPIPNSTFCRDFSVHKVFGMGNREVAGFGENSCSYGIIVQDQQHPQHPNTSVISSLHCSFASPRQVVVG